MTHNKWTNILTFMLDPRFKSLKVVENYVGRGDYIHLVAKCDVNVVFLLLMIVFKGESRVKYANEGFFLGGKYP